MLCYKASQGEGFIFRFEAFYTLGCVVRMVVDSVLPHAESGSNDHRKDGPPFNRYEMIAPYNALIKKCLADSP